MSLAEKWRHSLANVRLIHMNPRTNVDLVVVERPHSVRVLFKMTGLENSRDLGNEIEGLDYYFEASEWPGTQKCRLWTLAVWALLMEHEALEFAFYLDEHVADPHTSEFTSAHRAALDKRHDMNYMLDRLWIRTDEK
jgi:hypothetical protein